MLKKHYFDTVVNGKQISLYTLNGKNGFKLSATNFGARVVELWVSGKDGVYKDVVLGYNTIDQYLDNKGERFLGAVCGRFANRICNGHFRIGDTEYKLPVNNNGQTLHGGIKGLDSVVWDVVSCNDNQILFRYVSPDMEEGFPGMLTIEMRYELTDEDEFRITYNATTDKLTHVNLTHHSFFNLKGEGEGNVNGHILQIKGNRYIPVNNKLIPTGAIIPVYDTPMDFLRPTCIGSRLNVQFGQLAIAGGYDHCWVPDKLHNGEMEKVATVWEPESGRCMEVLTDQPGLQFYGGNFFDGKTVSKDGNSRYEYRGAFALETQHFPDTPNQPSFPSTLLRPGMVYTHRCVYRFSARTAFPCHE